MSQTVFVFKVALAARKKIWRRIAVRGDQTLDTLHWTIFNAFDRYDEHLYSFYFPKPGAKGRARLHGAEEYTHPFDAEENAIESKRRSNAEKARIDRLGLKPSQSFLYLFDFGDEWWHEITVEQIDAPAQNSQYPRILKTNGKSPPQYPDMDD